MGKKVIHVELHDGFFVPGMTRDGGQFGKSLPPAGKTLIDLEMTLQENGSVEVEWGPTQSRSIITIGAANIKYAKHAPEDKTKKAAK